MKSFSFEGEFTFFLEKCLTIEDIHNDVAGPTDQN